ncbi:MAG: RDD family protein, partial [Tepidiformaceae bacterium]
SGEGPTLAGGRLPGLQINWLLLLLLFIPQAAYYIVFPASRWMATPGKRMLGLRVTDASGERLGLIQSTWRFACQAFILWILIPFAIFVVPAGIIAVPIALVIVLAGKHDQSPWDMLAGTRVLE